MSAGQFGAYADEIASEREVVFDDGARYHTPDGHTHVTLERALAIVAMYGGHVVFLPTRGAS